ncbi:MAG TPA: DUF503 domain-containing protein [Desulfosalsimonadaceae bacterium]|nr:DUF503 domain-containing protein [Desulfosalsimonadaceae bacterium]
MVIGVGVITLGLHDCRSLKAKRGIIKSLVHRLRNGFNASIAEVNLNDSLTRAEVGFAMVGNDRRTINSKMDKLIDFTENLYLAELIETKMEIINI